jgi:CheY-like chemotaxis protein
MPIILIVEDEANVRKLVTINLVIRGYEVAETANGEQALASLHEHSPALMVLDIKLPDISGWDILRRINTDPTLEPDFPVLVMTASLVDSSIQLEHFPSVVGILVKPFRTDRLISAVRTALETDVGCG